MHISPESKQERAGDNFLWRSNDTFHNNSSSCQFPVKMQALENTSFLNWPLVTGHC